MKILLGEVAKANGYSIKDFANVLGVSYGTAYKWIKGGTQPGLNTLEQICNILHCKIDDIYKIERDERILEARRKEIEAQRLKLLAELEMLDQKLI